MNDREPELKFIRIRGSRIRLPLRFRLRLWWIRRRMTPFQRELERELDAYLDEKFTGVKRPPEPPK